MLLVDRVCDVVDPVSNRYRSLLLQVILQVSAAVPKIGIEPVLPPLPLRVSIPKNFSLLGCLLGVDSRYTINGRIYSHHRFYKLTGYGFERPLSAG